MSRLLLTAFAVTIALPLAAQARQQGMDFRWEGAVRAGNWVKLKNINGDVNVLPATGNSVEITALKRSRRGQAEEVRIEVTRYGANEEHVFVCAIWNEAPCDPERGYVSDKSRHGRDNDTEVEFTVRLPRGVHVQAGTVNGSVDVRGATAEVIASSVNGGVDAITEGGPVKASTVNGSVRASMRRLGDGEIKFSTVNGSIMVELPADVNADVEMKTVNGTLSSRDYPLTVQGPFSPRNMRATIGRGGGTRLQFHTVNGNVELRRGS